MPLVSSKIAGCLAYSSPSTCYLCAAGQYFLASSNACTSAELTPVPGCEYYATSNSCKFCTSTNNVNTSYFLFSGKCYPQNSPFCDHLLGPFTCADCARGYYPDATGRCTDANAANLAHCAVYATATTCKCCDSDYVVDESGGCVSRGSQIAGCSSYSDSMTCLYCASGLYYDPDTRSCKSV